MTDEHELDRWLEDAKKRSILHRLGDKINPLQIPGIERLLYPSSVQYKNGRTCALFRVNGRDLFGVFCKDKKAEEFHGIRKPTGSLTVTFCPLDHENAVRLRELFPFTAPSTLSKSPATFGTGDRLGIASPGHIRAVGQFKVAPVLVQQSVREIDLTRRSFEEVLDSATWAVFREGYKKPWGADGDHLKTEEWVKKVLSIGYTMITADVSDFIRGEYALKGRSGMRAAYECIPSDYRNTLEKRYFDSSVELDSGKTVILAGDEVSRAALIYREAIEHALRLYRAAVAIRGEGNFDFELSIDETFTPTTPQAHCFIAMELERSGVKAFSIAPRFVGEFQKGIDYIGDIDEFNDSLVVHAAIARRFGYKISVHSGSDKFLVFQSIGRVTGGEFHLKTAGTSWLEALKVISRKDPSLFRILYRYALDTFSDAQKYYQVSPALHTIPPIDEIDDHKLPALFVNPGVRQVLHITYGEVLKNPELKRKIYRVLDEQREEYWSALCTHLGKHLEGLGVPKL